MVSSRGRAILACMGSTTTGKTSYCETVSIDIMITTIPVDYVQYLYCKKVLLVWCYGNGAEGDLSNYPVSPTTYH